MEKKMEVQADGTWVFAKKRKTRKLAWNERQYGAGFISGVLCGIALGIPLTAGLAVLAKVFMAWLTTW